MQAYEEIDVVWKIRLPRVEPSHNEDKDMQTPHILEEPTPMLVQIFPRVSGVLFK